MAKKSIGMVTTAAAGGLTAGYALANILVWLLAQFGVNAEDVRADIGYVLQGVLAVYAGYLVPPAGTGKRVADDGD